MSGRYAAPRRGGPWPLAAWLMVAVVIVGLAVGILIGVFSPVLVLDLLSFWPAVAVAVILLVPAFSMRKRHPRLIAVPALIVLTWASLGTAVHLSGWPALPSGRARVVGPPVETSLARLTVALPEAELRVDGGSDAAYVVSPLRSGGGTGVPQGVDRVASDELQVVLEEQPPGPWFRFAGWRVTLSPQTAWAIEVTGGRVDLDLTDLSVRSVSVSGSGTVAVGEGSGRIRATGDLVVVVPRDAPAMVEGTASVPESWTEVDGGFAGPADGDGWIIGVPEGSNVIVRHP